MSSPRPLLIGGPPLDPATSAIVDAIDALVRSIVPTVDPPVRAEDLVFWVLPNHVIVAQLQLVDRAEAFGVLVARVPPRFLDVPWYQQPIRTVADVDANLAAAIRERIANLPAVPRPRPSRTSPLWYLLPLGHLMIAIDAVVALFRAPRWQQLAALAIPVWFVIGSAVANAVGTFGRSLPRLEPGFGGQVGILAGLAGWAVTAWWLARHVPQTDDERAAQFESFRINTLSLGCLGSIGWLVIAIYLGLIASELLIAVGAAWGASTAVLIGAVVGGLIASFWTIRELRRRYPPPPQTRVERFVGRALTAGAILAIALVVWIIADGVEPTVTPDQVGWCLGEGAATLERSIATRPVARTWTAETAATDPNFASACKLAWDATH